VLEDIALLEAIAVLLDTLGLEDEVGLVRSASCAASMPSTKSASGLERASDRSRRYSPGRAPAARSANRPSIATAPREVATPLLMTVDRAAALAVGVATPSSNSNR